MSDRVAAIILTVTIAVALIGGFLYTHERVDEEFFTPPTGEARYNRLLAAERLLRNLGYRARSEVEFAPEFALPTPDNTIFLYFNYTQLRNEELQALLQWVERGGHLVVRIYPRYGRPFDPLFTPLGIEVEHRPQEQDAEPVDEMTGAVELRMDDNLNEVDAAPRDVSKPPAEASSAKPVTPPDHLAGRAFWGDMSVDNDRFIDFGATETLWTVADERGIFAGQIGYEAGRITLLAEFRFADNRRIGNKDHAFILTRLLGHPNETGEVWLYYGRKFPSLWQMMWEKGAFLFKIGALLLVLLIWRAAKRFGPEIPAPPAERKAFLEHIGASGRFLWRRQQHEALLTKTQRAFLRDLERRHPASRQFDDQRRLHYLADICDMPVEKVDNALGPMTGRSHHQFVQKMQRLRILWKRI